METAVAFIIFNRPKETNIVFQQIARAQPRKLFIIADGPRPGNSEDIEKCENVRQIVSNVNWECEVLYNVAEENLGCGVRPATGINWVFEHVEKAIILEDDCIPHPTFFDYCDDLLEKYKNDERIMMIAGTNQISQTYEFDYSYHFAKVPNCWGWATWRRAWEHYDYDMKVWPMVKNTSWLSDFIGDPITEKHFWHVFNKAHEQKGNIDYWDYQWAFACWIQNGMTIIPNVNLVNNIGWDSNATHTVSRKSTSADLPMEKIEFPLSHPPHLIWHRESDVLRFHQTAQAKVKKKKDNYFFQYLKKNRLMNKCYHRLIRRK